MTKLYYNYSKFTRVCLKMNKSDQKLKCCVLFVCMGNTCRSTMAEGILRHIVKERGLQDQFHIDSAAIMHWQVGNPIDKRTVAVLRAKNIELFEHVARQITMEDFTTFDYILGMDNWNYEDLLEIKPHTSKAHVGLLGEFDHLARDKQIHDPFCSNKPVFEAVFKRCYDACIGLLDSIELKND